MGYSVRTTLLATLSGVLVGGAIVFGMSHSFASKSRRSGSVHPDHPVLETPIASPIQSPTCAIESVSFDSALQHSDSVCELLLDGRGLTAIPKNRSESTRLNSSHIPLSR